MVDSAGHLYFLYADDDFATQPTKGYKMHSTDPDVHGFYPIEDALKNLGGPNNQWKNVYTSGGVIEPVPPGVLSNADSFPYGLKEIIGLNSVRYSTSVESDDYKLGLDISELEKLIPEAVVKDEIIEVIDETTVIMTGEYDYGINYSALVPVLVKTIQEQQMMIEALEKEQERIEEQMVLIVKRVGAVEEE